MRSLLLAILATLAVPACTEDITGGKTGGGGDDQGSDTTCTCPDGTVMQGDDCATTCPAPTNPEADLSVDQPTIGTTTPVDLNVETDVTITATSVMGFAGDVALTIAVTDSTGAPITDWTTTLDNTTLTLTAGGTATAHIAISAQGDTAALVGNVKITATAGTMVTSTTIATTFAPEVRVEFKDDPNLAGGCLYPDNHGAANPYKVKAGRTLAVYNLSTGTVPFIVHSNLTAANGFPHETQALPATAAPNAYKGVQAPSTGLLSTNGGTTASTDFYCHQGVAGTMLESAAQAANRPNLVIVQ